MTTRSRAEQFREQRNVLPDEADTAHAVVADMTECSAVHSAKSLATAVADGLTSRMYRIHPEIQRNKQRGGQ